MSFKLNFVKVMIFPLFWVLQEKVLEFLPIFLKNILTSLHTFHNYLSKSLDVSGDLLAYQLLIALGLTLLGTLTSFL